MPFRASKHVFRWSTRSVMLMLLAFPALTLAQEVAYNGSMEFARGNYLFHRRTDSFYFLNGLEVSAGRFYVQATVPVILQSTPWISYGPTQIPSGGSDSGEVARQLGGRGQTGQGNGRRTVIQLPADSLSYQTGIADPSVQGHVEVFRTDRETLAVRLGGGVKVPAANPDDGFATGEWDYGGGVFLTANASERDSLFADMSYQVFGDMPDLAFRNAFAYAVSYRRTLSRNRWTALVSVYGMTRILDNSDPPVQFSLGFTHFHDGGRSMNMGVALGLSETVPDLSLHVGWRFGL